METPRVKTIEKYIIIKAPPPPALTLPGNFQIFPKPMALPAVAIIKPKFDDHAPRD
jgi:hypothetical protein